MAAGTLVGLTSVQADGNSPDKCTFDLSGDVGEAKIKIKPGKLEVKFKNALPNTLHTVWIDFRNRAEKKVGSTQKAMADDYPIPFNVRGVDLSNTGPGIARGIAPAFATTQGVTSGMGLDANGIITKNKGNGKLNLKLDYNLLRPGDSPVVAADLVNAGEDETNRIGGGWLRLYQSPIASGASNQAVDPVTGLPVVIRATAQGITIVSHVDRITHGHTPGVGGGVDHSGDDFPGFKGDFPADCLGS